VAVAFDNTTFFSSAAATTITTPAFIISAGANRAAGLGWSGTNNLISAISGSVGGVAGAAVAGADTTTTNASGRCLLFVVTAPPSGSQTATMSWTTASNVTLGVATATGVDQTTPMNNGVNAVGNLTTTSLTVTSTNGDLTMDVAGAFVNSFSATNQTVLWNDTAGASGAGGRGPGTGTTTHTWTQAFTGDWAQAGANFKAAAGAAAALKRNSSLSALGASGPFFHDPLAMAAA
jgi:hypothetical protein